MLPDCNAIMSKCWHGLMLCLARQYYCYGAIVLVQSVVGIDHPNMF